MNGVAPTGVGTFRKLSLRLSRAEPGEAGRRRRAGSPSLAGDRRGAVALETVLVWAFLMFALFLPLADVAIAGFQFLSAWGALGTFGQYVVQKSIDPSWQPTQTTVSGYAISKPQLSCEDSNAVCFYSYSTTVTLSPLLLTSLLCPSSCTYPLPYSVRVPRAS